MLPKKRRITNKIFTLINKQNKGKNFFSPYMSLQLIEAGGIETIIENKKNTGSKFATIVSKKTERLAVGRNKIRRQVYSLLRNNLKKIKSGFIGVFFIKKEFKKLKFIQKENEVQKLLEKAGLLLKP